MTSPPIGTDEELIVRLRKYGHIEAADALLSRIAEVEELFGLLDELDYWLKSGNSKAGGNELQLRVGIALDKYRAALSQHGKV